jgi:hypothetical protein
MRRERTETTGRRERGEEEKWGEIIHVIFF